VSKYKKIKKKYLKIRTLISISPDDNKLGTFKSTRLQDTRIISENIPLAKNKKYFEFHNKLTGIMIDKTETMVSLDITPLFTNVPLDVALDGLMERWDSTKISKKEFINAVKFVLTLTYFTFNGIIYKQTFGTPMDFLPIISDIFMKNLEEKVFHSLQFRFLYFMLMMSL